jgi:beta-N-acetylhexosaminidase
MAKHYQSRHAANSDKPYRERTRQAAEPARIAEPAAQTDYLTEADYLKETTIPRDDDYRMETDLPAANESFVDANDADYNEAPRSSEPSKAPGSRKCRVACVILSVILALVLIGGGVFALIHFGVISLPSAAPTEAPTDSFVEPTLTPTPTMATEAPTEPSAEPDYTPAAQQLLSGMTDREKFLQLIITTPEVLTGVDGVTQAGDTTKKAIEDYPVGGIVYSDTNFEDIQQTMDLLSKSQSYAKTPMFLAVDEEGGDVARVASKLGTKKFSNMLTYKDKGIQTAHDNAEVIASNLRAIGFNLDFAPVADVLTNPENTVIGSRAYSDNYEDAARLVASAVTGFKDGGVLCTLKHFPGHGGTAEDSHEGLAYIDKTAEEITAGELLPFKSGIDAGADMVMVGHLVVKHFDADLPATLSPSVVPYMLRGQYNYDGVVITDSMQMGAITENFSHEQIVQGIFNADIDMILMPDDLDGYVEAFEKLLADGSITREQLDQKVMRVLMLKLNRKIIRTDESGGASAGSVEEAPAGNLALDEDADLPEETLTPAA